MAEFCKQCAEEYGFPNDAKRDTPSIPPLEEGEGWMFLCEGCGVTLVKDDGECFGSTCLKHHGKEK